MLQLLLEQRLHAVAAPLAKLGADALETLCYGWFSTAFTRAVPREASCMHASLSGVYGGFVHTSGCVPCVYLLSQKLH